MGHVVSVKASNKQVVMLVSALLCLSSIQQIYALQGSPVLTGPNISGKSLEELAQSYWNWLVTVPAEVADKCYFGTDTNETLIFLLSPYGEVSYEATCTIPSKPILFPLLASICYVGPGGCTELSTGSTIEEYWSAAAFYNKGFLGWEVKLDGNIITKKSSSPVEQRNVQFLDKALVRNSSFFSFNIPEVNRWEQKEYGTFRAVVDGWYIVLAPLPPGPHTLEYEITQRDPESSDPLPAGDRFRVKYLLNVVDRPDSLG